MAEIRVRIGQGGYPVHVGTGMIESELSRQLVRLAPHRVVVVSHPGLMDLHGRRLWAALEGTDSGSMERHEFLFPAGEENKNLETLERGYHALLVSGIAREDLLLAFGGGVVGDLAGFMAASFMRGIRYLQVPTTLMAMVDSSIGGKVGVDLPGAKNAIGAFYQPDAVVADVALLDTLPERELLSGLAEVAKYGFLYDGGLLETMSSWSQRPPRNGGEFAGPIAVCAEHKARVVGADERDLSGERAMLNYGHTFGHAIESAAGYGSLRHGEAVAMGMIMAARLAEAIGLCGVGMYDLHRRILLPLLRRQPATVRLEVERILLDMQSDKKKGKGLRFVLLAGPQAPRLVENVEEGAVASAVAESLELLRGEEICL